MKQRGSWVAGNRGKRGHGPGTKVAQELEKQEDQREKKSGPCSSFTIDFECCIYVGQADSRDVRGTEINYGQRTKESPREGKCFREPEGNSE